MKSFGTHLTRERFVIREPQSKNGEVSTVALSNRVAVDLTGAKGNVEESFAVRTQNMHGCVRMAAKILESHRRAGLILKRTPPFDFSNAWASIQSDYEKSHNSDRWAAVYAQGKPLFTDGEYHPFLDLIEKCALHNRKEYDHAVTLAENAFKKTGKDIKVEYDANVALVANLDETEGRCGIILRGTRTATFSFSIYKKNEINVNYAQCLMACAAFLEGIQLCFLIGNNLGKLEKGEIEPRSEANSRRKRAEKRIKDLKAEITNLEYTFTVRYRPERPDFDAIIKESYDQSLRSR